MSTPVVHWHAWSNPQGQSTGVLEIVVTGKRIWSVPSLWGCPVGCTFCVSSSQAYGGPINASDLQDLLNHVRTNSIGHEPVELSFTGEGEAVLNVTNVLALIEHTRYWPEIASARVCVSGLKMERAKELSRFPWPTRLQCSLHSAVQSTRDKLIPKSVDVNTLRGHLVELQPLFACIDLNVVLQEGINDSDAHLSALLSFTRATPWRVVFNPHMQQGSIHAHPKSSSWAAALNNAGTPASVYRTIGEKIVQKELYQKLTFVRGVSTPNAKGTP